MADWNKYNPFSKREAHGANSILAYKIFTLLTWVLSVVTSVYYTINEPHDGFTIRKRIWDQNYLYPSAFTMNSTIADVFWVILFVLQLGYITHLFSKNTDHVHAAASVGSHFILNNLFHFAFVMLFVRSHFFWAEVILVINFVNLTSLYFRHNTYPRFIHTPVVSAPLAWTFVAIYWNGAIMVHHPTSLIARIFGNIFIWAILGYGLFFIAIYKDYTMGFSLSVLAAAIGVAQFLRQIIALQWIFAFTIMAILFVMTLVVAVPAWSGREVQWRRAPPQDAEPSLGKGGEVGLPKWPQRNKIHQASQMKPLRPFPLPLNVGTDICQISRIYGIVAGPRRSRFINRILTPEEWSRKQLQLNGDTAGHGATNGGTPPPKHQKLSDGLQTQRDPDLWKVAVFVAGRFAAKEAAIKAHPLRRLTFHDIIIERLEQEGSRLGSGPPIARIKAESATDDDTTALISISHDGDYATAVCIGHVASGPSPSS
ncbi:atp synthase f0 [Paramyrothecium foliicola]|nr:atp synthase f0 [Paramyrothecium foliicola]